MDDNSGTELNFILKVLNPRLRATINQFAETGRTKGPIVVEFDPTSNCNFSCPECISLELLNKGQFSKQRTEEIVREFYEAGVKGVIFIGGGEPLAHSGMPKPIILARELGMAVGLTTNGSLIGRYKEVIAANVNWTRVSLDAGTEKMHSAVRPSRIRSAFSKIVASMTELAKIKTGILGYSFLILQRDTLDSQTNCNELFMAGKLAKDIGCDYFEFKPAVDLGHNLIPFSSTVRAQLLDQMEKLSALKSDNFRVIYPNSIVHLLTENSVEQPKEYHSCPSLELRTVVTPSGIYPCPYKRGTLEIGNSGRNFKEFWTSKDRISATRSIDPSRDCPFYCIRHETNLFLNSLSSDYLKGVDMMQYIMSKDNKDDIFL